jgi:hypothetical protein
MQGKYVISSYQYFLFFIKVKYADSINVWFI